MAITYDDGYPAPKPLNDWPRYPWMDAAKMNEAALNGTKPRTKDVANAEFCSLARSILASVHLNAELNTFKSIWLGLMWKIPAPTNWSTTGHEI